VEKEGQTQKGIGLDELKEEVVVEQVSKGEIEFSKIDKGGHC